MKRSVAVDVLALALSAALFFGCGRQEVSERHVHCVEAVGTKAYQATFLGTLVGLPAVYLVTKDGEEIARDGDPSGGNRLPYIFHDRLLSGNNEYCQAG